MQCIVGVENLLDLLAEHADNITTGNLILDENEVLDVAPYKVNNVRAFFLQTNNECDYLCETHYDPVLRRVSCHFLGYWLYDFLFIALQKLVILI